MKLTVTRSGGFAGLVETLGTVDSTSLAPDVAREMLDKVHACRFFELPREIEGTGVGADLYQYELTVSDGERSHCVTFRDDETQATKPLLDLMAWASRVHT